MELQAEATVAAGVTFVRAVIQNSTDEPMRFRVASTIDGPVWPPRRNGHVERGWDGNGYEGYLAAGTRRPIGFATSGTPEDEPLRLVWTERTTEEAPRPDAATTIRRYRDPRPPRAVLSPVSLPNDSVSSFDQPNASIAGGSR